MIGNGMGSFWFRINSVLKLARRWVRELRSSHKSSAIIQVIEPEFHAAFYLKSYPDVLVAGVDPLEHYVKFGAREERDPSPLFSTGDYLTENPDVRAAGVNPFWHYIQHGRIEGRRSKIAGSFRVHRLERAFGIKSNLRYNEIYSRFRSRSQEVLSSPKFLEISAKLREVEPAIGDLSDYKNIVFSPLHQKLGWYHLILTEKLKREHYDSIICVPRITLGGADLVTGLTIHSLLRIRSDEKILSSLKRLCRLRMG